MPASIADRVRQELDFMNLDALYSDEERAIRDQVRAWAAERLQPIVAEHWENGTFPKELSPEFGEMGLLGPTLPEKYGGLGLNAVQYGLICQEIERVDSGIRSFMSVQGALVMYPIFAFGSEEQKKQWLPQLAKGTKIGCFGLTEPDFGSDPGGMRARCRKVGGEWVLDGQKMWITNGTQADVSIFWAKDEQGVVQGFLVEKERKGFTAPEQKHKWSLRCSVTSELVADAVRVPEANRLPNTQGLKSALSCLTQARYGIAWGAVGAAQDCFAEALGYTLQRQIHGGPLARFQITQTKLADMATEITKGQLLVWRLGRLKDEGKVRPQQVSMAKRNNVHMALEISRECRTLLGANGITLEYRAGRHMCNLETVLTYEGTHEVHGLIIGHDLTGIPAYGG